MWIMQKSNYSCLSRKRELGWGRCLNIKFKGILELTIPSDHREKCIFMHGKNDVLMVVQIGKGPKGVLRAFLNCMR